VQVFDADVDEATEVPFLAMELLEGRTLAALLDEEEQLAPARVHALLAQMARGLDAAHGRVDERGRPRCIVHGDLKPENLFVGRSVRGSEWVKILDFGIAEELTEASVSRSELWGSPLYAAPEQVLGLAVSAQTDIWALGLIAYRTLSGRNYWRSVSSSRGQFQCLFAEILGLHLDKPSQRAREQGAAVELPVAFDDWLLRCLARDPARRFVSAGEAARRLRAALEGVAAGRHGRRSNAPRASASSCSGVAPSAASASSRRCVL
jgi:serine/threonine protein kinase